MMDSTGSPQAQRIVFHEHWQETPYVEMLRREYWRSGLGALPPTGQAQGQVLAYINQGRWVADCDTPGCGGAVCLSWLVELFICPYCGSGGYWRAVVWPPDWEAIVEQLLKRPALKPFYADHRNWRPGETVDDLKAENAARGLS